MSLSHLRMMMALPEITDADIDAAEYRLGFRFDEPRREFLKRMDTLDVQSCAGSGKTTLLVTKLDILARKWTSRSQGICVLSHTNVAKEEIRRRLGGRASGIKLLSHPHFVGTIQEFVNRFIALPWLRSHGYQIMYLDNDIFGEMARSIGASNSFLKPRRYFERRHADFDEVLSKLTLEFNQETFSLVAYIQNSNTLPSVQSETYKQLCSLKQGLISKGIWRYEDMFALAKAHLQCNPNIVTALRARFPLNILDETQDTQAYQLSLLEQIFPPDTCHVQRLGDANQAIFFSVASAQGASFPRDPDTALDLNTTHRFGQWVADQASTTGILSQQITSNYDGQCYPHTVFVCDEESRDRVLPAFAELVSSIDWQEDCDAHAVGAIGKDGNPPKIGDYWPDYERSIRSKAANPPTLIGFVRLARSLAASEGNFHEAAPKLRDGVVHLAKQCGVVTKDGSTLTWNRLCEGLLEQPELLKRLHLAVFNLITVTDLQDEAVWQSMIDELATIMSGIGGDISETDGFEAWHQVAGAAPNSASARKVNVFVHNGVEVKMGTIHSVKGETHDATLVLETKWYDQDLQKATNWLIETDKHPPRQIRQIERFKRLHVGMTRPRHLLCLAMNVTNNGDDKLSELAARGWRIHDLRLKQ